MGSIESDLNIESSLEEEPSQTSRVMLHFLRHEAKAAAAPGQHDRTAELTEAGRAAALERAKQEPANPQVGWAAGSERIRSAHTALLRLMGNSAELTPEMNFEEARAEVEKELKVGKKVTTLPELNFDWDGTPEYNAASMAAYKGGSGLKWILNESDNKAIALGDTRSTSYSRVAANYAALISREMSVGNNFNRIVSQDFEKYGQANNTIERWFGTHQTVSETFVMKVLEKTQGRNAAVQFIESFRDKDGKVFGADFEEGINVEIENEHNGQRVTLHGMRGLPDIQLTPELLSEIIEDAENMDAEIEHAQKQA